MDWLRHSGDKLLMTLIFGAMLAVYVHSMHHQPIDEGALTWLQQKTGEVLASILTLTAARALMGAKNGNGAQPPVVDAHKKDEMSAT